MKKHISLLELDNGIAYYQNQCVRSGLRLCFDKNIDFEIKNSIKTFCKWLRQKYEFPIRFPIYIKSSYYIKASDGSHVSAIFFQPDDKLIEPYAKISTGDYYDLKKEIGDKNALVSINHSIAHEFIHYIQWINNVNASPRKEEWQASFYATYLIKKFLAEVDF